MAMESTVPSARDVCLYATLDRQVAALSAALVAVQSDQRALAVIKQLVQLQSQLIEVLQPLVDGLQQERRWCNAAIFVFHVGLHLAVSVHT